MRNGIKYNVNHIIPAKITAFLNSLFPVKEFLDNANTIPNNASIDVPKIAPARIYPLFCHTRRPSFSTKIQEYLPIHQMQKDSDFQFQLLDQDRVLQLQN